MNKKLTIRLLGTVAIEVDGRPLTGLPSRAAEALLIYLVCHDRPIPREALADLLWSERTQKQGLTNLRTILTALRRELDDNLIITRQTLAFNRAADYWLDAAEFEDQLTHHGSHLQGDTPLPAATANLLQSAVDLYRGDFLASFHLRDGREFETWALLQREQLKRLAGLGLQRLVAHYLTTGDYQQGLRNAEKLHELNPYHDAAQRQLMWLLIRSGQPNVAVQRYQQFTRLLAEELGVEPAQETTRLYQRIKVASALRVDKLPRHSTPLAGRTTELQRLKGFLADPHCRLLTLVGPGGIGKTRLALEAAGQQQQALLHGVCFVSLAALPSVDLLALAIAEALQLSLPSVGNPHAQLLNALHEREILLLLDNFEHLLAPLPPLPKLGKGESRGDGSRSPQLTTGLALLIDILAAAPEVKIMVTSRERLNLEEEWLFQVDSLPTPAEAAAAYEIANNSAVRLFLRNVSRVQTGFGPTEAEMAEIGRICRLVEGMPLAINLASAWVPAMSFREIAAEIEGDLAFLQSGARNALSRHQSIEAVFDYSWQLLTPDEQQFLARLSVFQGGFTPRAAQHVAGAAVPALARLIDKSWLTLNANGRYEWHELLRRYAAKKLELGRTGKMTKTKVIAHTQHAEYYAVFLKEQLAYLESKKQVEALAAVTAELDNVRAAWQWIITYNEFELILWSLESVWSYYEIKCWFQEGEEMFRQAAEALAKHGPAEAQQQQLLAQLLIRQGWFCMRLARFEQAINLLEQGLNLTRQVQNQLETGRALHHLGVVTGHLGQYAAAEQFLEESLAIYRQNGGNHFDLGSALGTLGTVLLKMGRFDEAKPVIDEGKIHYLQSGNPRAIALMYSFLGGFSIQTGNYREAKSLLHEGLTFQKMIDDRVMIRMSLVWLGEVNETLAEYDEAKQQYEESLLISRGNGDQVGMATALSNLGRVSLALGEVRQAKGYLRDGLRLATEIQFIPLIIDGIIGVSMLLAKIGEPERALDVLIPALANPACEPQMRARAERLLAELTDAPAAEILARAQPAQSLEAVVTGLSAAGTLLDAEMPEIL